MESPYTPDFLLSIVISSEISSPSFLATNSGTVRSAVLKYLGYLGITVDEKANDTHGEEITISTPDSKVLVMVIPTNEELAIARETVALV